MPRTTKTFDLEEEKQRIDEQLDKFADKEAEDIKARESENETPSPQHEREERHQEAQRLDQMLTGVKWALDPPEDEDVEPIEEVTLGALNAAEYGMVSDYVSNEVDSKRQRNGDKRRGDRMKRTIFAAGAIIEAPFIDDDTRNSDLETKYHAVAQLAPQFVYWMEQRGDELTTPEVEGNGFAKRVEERMTADGHSTPSPKHS